MTRVKATKIANIAKPMITNIASYIAASVFEALCKVGGHKGSRTEPRRSDKGGIKTAAFALRHRLPTMTLMGSVGQVGQLITYGANFGEQVLRVAGYVDRILKGAKPADLPVEQPTTFELVIT